MQRSISKPRHAGAHGRVAYLDGIRAIAIAGVFSTHWFNWIFGRGFLGGYVGVDLFFVLSGYIITSIIIKSESLTYSTFLRRRIARLYPPLIGLIVVGTLLAAIIPGSPVSFMGAAKDAVIAVSQLSSLWRGADLGSLRVFGVTWSLAVEWYFYLAWPLLLFSMRRRGIRPTTAHARLTVLVAAFIYALALFQSPMWFYFGPLARIAELMCGSALAIYLYAAPDSRPRMAEATFTRVLAVGVAALGLWGLNGPAEGSYLYRYIGLPLGVAVVSGLIVAGAMWPRSFWPRLLARRAITALGRASYSLYLWNAVPLSLVGSRTPHMPKFLLISLEMALVAGFATLSYRVLERPRARSHAGVLAAPASVFAPDVPNLRAG